MYLTDEEIEVLKLTNTYDDYMNGTLTYENLKFLQKYLNDEDYVEEYQNNYKWKSRRELKKMSTPDIEKYYLEKRKYEFDNNIPLKNMRIRKCIHPLLLELIKVDCKMAKEKIHIIADRRTHKKKQIIYAPTHTGGNDVSVKSLALDS